MSAMELAGYTVGVTADRRADEQISLLERRGARVIHGPTIRTLPIEAEDELRSVVGALIAQPPDVFIANTGLGVRSLLSAADAWGLGDELVAAIGAAHILARGPKAAGALHQVGVQVDHRAITEQLDELVELLLAEGVAGKRIAFQRHGDEAPDVVDALRAAGADVVEIPVYRWQLPDDLKPAIRLIEAIIAGSVHAVTFTSAPAARNLVAIAEEADLANALLTAFERTVLAICVGPVCAAAAAEVGIGNIVTPEVARLGPMIRTVTDSLSATGRGVTIGSHALELHGLIASIDGVSVSLSEREAAVLVLLLQRPGVVTSKRDLLAAVWGDATQDDHVVEVTIGRLRSRLGAAADGLQTVRRRGYRISTTSPLVPVGAPTG